MLPKRVLSLKRWTTRIHYSSASTSGTTAMAIVSTDSLRIQSRSHGHGHGHHHHHHHHELDTKAMSERHAALCKRITMAGGLTNLTFAVWKIFLGSQSGGSVALSADGMHMAVDLTSDVVSLTAILLSRHWPLKKRCRFPFGTGRIETIASLFIAGLLCTGALSILYRSLGRMSEQSPPSPSHSHSSSAAAVDDDEGNCSSSPPGSTGSIGNSCSDEKAKQHHRHSGGCQHHQCSGGLGHSHFDVGQYVGVDRKDRPADWVVIGMFSAAILSLIAKETLFRFGRRIGRETGSAVVIANAYHHRADAWSSAVALVGVCGTVAGVPAVDSVAAVCVSSAVLKVGLGLAKNAVQELVSYQSTEYERRSANVDRTVLRCSYGPKAKQMSSVHAGDVAAIPRDVFSSPHNSMAIALVNVGALQHGHTIHITGALVVPPKATSADIAVAASVLKQRFTEEFHCCCPNVELLYRILLWDEATDDETDIETFAEKTLDQKEEKTVDTGTCCSVCEPQPVEAGRTRQEIVQLVIDYHHLDKQEAFDCVARPWHEEADTRSGRRSRKEPEAKSNCQRDLEALRFFFATHQCDKHSGGSTRCNCNAHTGLPEETK